MKAQLLLICLLLVGCKLDPLSQSRLNKTPQQTGCNIIYWDGYTSGNKSWIVKGCNMFYECNDNGCIKRADIKRQNDDFELIMLISG